MVEGGKAVTCMSSPSTPLPLTLLAPGPLPPAADSAATAAATTAATATDGGVGDLDLYHLGGVILPPVDNNNWQRKRQRQRRQQQQKHCLATEVTAAVAEENNNSGGDSGKKPAYYRQQKYTRTGIKRDTHGSYTGASAVYVRKEQRANYPISRSS